jgi:hypothetical protein
MSQQEEIVVTTEELTDTLQVVTETFTHLKADHRPSGPDWFRWLIYNAETSKVIGFIGLNDPNERALPLPARKVLLRIRAMDLLRDAA